MYHSHFYYFFLRSSLPQIYHFTDEIKEEEKLQERNISELRSFHQINLKSLSTSFLLINCQYYYHLSIICEASNVQLITIPSPTSHILPQCRKEP